MADELDKFLDPNLLHEFCSTWIGSGDSNPLVVFVGMEFSTEATSIRTANAFFYQWNLLGNDDEKGLISDYKTFAELHHRMNNENFDFLKHAARNTTRNRMSRIAYSFLNRVEYADLDNQRNKLKLFKEKFASKGSGTASLELWPLPCLKQNHFDYDIWLNNSFGENSQFNNKETYKKEYKDIRVKLLKNIVNNNSVKLVVFYSNTQKEYFEEIAGLTFDEPKVKDGRPYSIKSLNGKIFLLTDHLSYRGITKNYLNSLVEDVLRLK